MGTILASTHSIMCTQTHANTHGNLPVSGGHPQIPSWRFHLWTSSILRLNAMEPSSTFWSSRDPRFFSSLFIFCYLLRSCHASCACISCNVPPQSRPHTLLLTHIGTYCIISNTERQDNLEHWQFNPTGSSPLFRIPDRRIPLATRGGKATIQPSIFLMEKIVEFVKSWNCLAYTYSFYRYRPVCIVDISS